jgi:uncharacterized protein DUF3562
MAIAMTNAQQIAPGHTASFDRRLAEAIARDTAAPIELVSRIYREELDALASNARLTQFLHVIAARRARLRLRQH